MTRIKFENSPSTNTPINAENLNKLNNVIVSSEEPTTGEEVWLERSGNIFDKNNYNLWNGWINESNNTFTENSKGYLVYISCSPNTTYIVSREVLETNFKVGVADKTPINQGNLTNVINNPYGNSITITSGANDRYLHIYIHYASDTNYTLEQILDSLRVETPKKIHTKTDNGYEEFYNEEDNKNEWNFFKSYSTLNTYTTLPSEFNELYIDVILNNNHIHFIIPRILLNSTEKTFRNGYYFLDTASGSCVIMATETQIKFKDCYKDGAILSSNVTMEIYYR